MRLFGQPAAHLACTPSNGQNKPPPPPPSFGFQSSTYRREISDLHECGGSCWATVSKDWRLLRAQVGARVLVRMTGPPFGGHLTHCAQAKLRGESGGGGEGNLSYNSHSTNARCPPCSRSLALALTHTDAINFKAVVENLAAGPFFSPGQSTQGQNVSDTLAVGNSGPSIGCFFLVC